MTETTTAMTTTIEVNTNIDTRFLSMLVSLGSTYPFYAKNPLVVNEVIFGLKRWDSQ